MKYKSFLELCETNALLLQMIISEGSIKLLNKMGTINFWSKSDSNQNRSWTDLCIF